MAYTAIDIGSAATNRAGTGSTSNSSRVFVDNPANETGVLTYFETWMATAVTDNSLRVGTLHGSGTTYAARDYELIGNCAAGSKQTYTGKNCSVESGDYIGSYFNVGGTEQDSGSGGGHYRLANTNAFADTNNHTYSALSSGTTTSLYATGGTLPDAPTNVSASENDPDKVTISWTAGTGETSGHVVYRDGVDCSGVVAHGTSTFNDTNADPPASVITPGTTAASDGTDADKVILSVSGHSIKSGTVHVYTVKAINATGYSVASSSDNGSRVSNLTLTYQWQRSAVDSDADYSDIAGATTNPYDDTGAP